MHLNEVMPLRVTMFFPRCINYLEKNPVQPGRPFFELLASGIQETLKTLYAIALAFGCLKELEDKTLLLKSPQTSDNLGII